MQTKASLPLTYLENKKALPLIKAYFEFNHLKQLFRQGWLRHGIPPERCESVAEHTFGVALLAMFLADAFFPGIDLLKVVRMALLHDIGEVYAGDITPADQVSPDEKYAQERESIVKVLEKLPNGSVYIALWDEFERGNTAEAIFVRQVDRLEMAMQASVYEHQQLGTLQEFFLSTQTVLRAPELRRILGALLALRTEAERSLTGPPEAG